MIREFAAGVRTLLRGFGLWRTRPGLMALGLIPAIIAFLVLAAAIVPLVWGMPSVSAWLTPFAEGWIEPWRGLLRRRRDRRRRTHGRDQPEGPLARGLTSAPRRARAVAAPRPTP
nr:hypothetical protein [Microbacterium barkeri]